MSFILIGGFARQGKIRLIQHITEQITTRGADQMIALILNEVNEDELVNIGLDSDTIHVSELKGGCPCCSMGGELANLLRTPKLKRSHVVVIEVEGTCDIEQLSRALKSEPGTELASYLVVEASSLRPLLEIVPVLRRNIEFCDAVVLATGPGEGDGVLRDANNALDAILGARVTSQLISGDVALLVRPGPRR